MLDEMIAEQHFKQAKEADRRRMAMELEARALYRDPGVRERAAQALVAVGGWLDRGAIERAAKVGRPVRQGRVLR